MKIYREMVRSISMGIRAIDNVMRYVENDALGETMKEQKKALEEYCSQAKSELSEKEVSEAEGSKFSQTMIKASSAISAMVNSDSSHLSRMLIEGYEMGIVSLQKCINEMQNKQKEVPAAAKELIKFYDKSIKTLRTYL